MQAFGWTWRELQDTPAYVRAYSWDLLSAKRSARNAAAKR